MQDASAGPGALRSTAWISRPLLLAALLSPASLLATGCRARPWFESAGERLGLDFSYRSGARGDLYMPEIMGAGVAMLDLDNDGDLDLYLPDGNDDLPGFGEGDRGDRLYLQEKGRFRDATANMGIAERGYSMGVAAGDVDNDGLVDLFVTNVGADRLLRNLGGGRFADVTQASGIDEQGWSVSAAFCDVDGDGLLDLYVARYLDFDPGQHCQNIAGEPEYCGPKSYRPLSDRLYRNRGGGRFEDRSDEAGIAGVSAAGLGVVCSDFSGDGKVDLYVANDGDGNLLWINDGTGRFQERAVAWGAAYDLRGRAQAGMGLAAADLSLDGRDDLLVTNLRDEVNTLYVAQGEAFLDQTASSGLGPPSLPLTGFGVVAPDFDLDGWPDVAVANGRVRRYAPLPGAWLPEPWRRLGEPGSLYTGAGGGRFESAPPGVCGAPCLDQDLGRGLVAGDVDGDGDLDLLRGAIEGPTRLYLNEAPRQGRWIALRLVDPRYRRDAIGAVLTIAAAGRQWRRSIVGGGSYGSAGPLEVHVGLGDGRAPIKLTVAWPDGLTERFALPCVDCRRTLERGSGEAVP